jgi:hypothetical protein
MFSLRKQAKNARARPSSSTPAPLRGPPTSDTCKAYSHLLHPQPSEEPEDYEYNDDEPPPSNRCGAKKPKRAMKHWNQIIGICVSLVFYHQKKNSLTLPLQPSSRAKRHGLLSSIRVSSTSRQRTDVSSRPQISRPIALVAGAAVSAKKVRSLRISTSKPLAEISPFYIMF